MQDFVFVGIPFILARRIEKYLMNRLDPEVNAKLNEELKKFPEKDVGKFPDIKNISSNTQIVLYNRRGAGTVAVWLTKIVVVDFAVQVADGNAISSTIWSDTADNAAGSIAKYGTAIIHAPGNKFAKFVKKLRGIDPKYDDIKDLLLDKELTVAEKLELLKIKIERTIKELRGIKRTKFILFVIAALLFFFGGGNLFQLEPLLLLQLLWTA